MRDQLEKIYKNLCAELGQAEYQKQGIEEKIAEIKKRLENLQWVNKNLTVEPEVVEDTNG